MTGPWNLTESQRRQLRDAHAAAKQKRAAARDRRHREAVEADPYANAVIGALSADFPDLRDPVVADIVRKAIYAHVHVAADLEVIVDSPFSANWRLIPAPHDRRRVHLGCWRQNRTEEDCERWARLNKALDALPMPE